MVSSGAPESSNCPPGSRLMAPAPVGEHPVLEHLEVGEERIRGVGSNRHQDDVTDVRRILQQLAPVFGVEDQEPVSGRARDQADRAARPPEPEEGLGDPDVLAPHQALPVALGVDGFEIGGHCRWRKVEAHRRSFG